jgi:ABC-2 type transport system permease protein
VLIVVSALMGLRISLGGIVLLFGLMALIGIMMTALSYGLALTVRDENSLAATLNTITLPVMLLSGVLLPLALAPDILRTLAAVNPFSHAVDAARALVNGDLGDAAVPGGFILIAVLAMLALWWAKELFRKAAA